MTDAQLKKEWQSLLGGLIGEQRKLSTISEFDQLTSRMHGAGIISFDEFLGAQHAIVAAKTVAKNMAAYAATPPYTGAPAMYQITGQSEGNGFRVFQVQGPHGIELKPIAIKSEWFAGETEMHDHALQCAREQYEGLREASRDYRNRRYY